MRKIELAKLIIIAVALTGFGAFLFTNNAGNSTATAHSAGPPDGVTNAPGEKNCSECHTPQATSAGQFTITAPATYTPGQTYTITVTHTSSDPTRQRWGFELTALLDDNTRAGDLQSTNASTQVIAGQIFPGRQYIEHTSAGTFAGQKNGASWSFNWTAPAAGAGPVTFYAAGNQANDDGNSSGDKIYTSFVGSRPAGPSGSFSVAATTPPSAAVSQGGSIQYSVTITPSGGFTGQVALSVSGLPAGVTASFAPALVNINNASAQASLLTIATTSVTPLGTVSPTITASMGSLQSTTTTSLTVYAPGTNPIDDARYFVRQHYLDFLSREPDQAGWDYWSSQITQCGSDPTCIHSRRIGVSAAFFIELEFQITGSYVYNLYKAGLGRPPTFAEFSADRSLLHAGSTLTADKQNLTLGFVQRPEFVNKYQSDMSAATFVADVLKTAQGDSGADLSSLQSSLTGMYDGSNTGRAAIVEAVAENATFVQAEYNRAFVQMQYFGYLKRDSDQGGYDFWLNILNTKVPNDSSGYRSMVCAFLTSTEYQVRFGTVVTHHNSECGP